MMSRDKRMRSNSDPVASVLVEFLPLPTLKCLGLPSFRTQSGLDLACILDLNPDVSQWSTRSPELNLGTCEHTAEIWLRDAEGRAWLIDSPEHIPSFDIDYVDSVARGIGYRYRVASRDEIYSGYRLQNARDLLRYARFSPSLSDRIPLLAALDEEGSLSLADAMMAVGGRNPVAVVASLILHGLLEVELDDALIGPETMVRRIRS